MKVLVTGILPEDVMALIKKEHEVEANEEDHPIERQRLLRSIGDKDGLLCMITDTIDVELLDKAPRLKVVANCGVGFNNVDLKATTQRSIIVCNTPGVLTDATADTAFALIMATARRVVEGDKLTRRGEFRFWAPFHFLGHEVTGKVLGIIGMGRIGQALAKRAAGFDMKVIYFDSSRLDPEKEKSLGIKSVSMETLISTADVISLHVPLTEETRHLINRETLEKMKPTSYLINTSRGPVVDEVALVEALRANKISGAGLDVYENEPELAPGLKELDNVVLLPHVGSATLETRTKMTSLAAENLLAGLRGDRPLNCLNWQAEVSGARRLRPWNS
jgi:glyoxylate reductase